MANGNRVQGAKVKCAAFRAGVKVSHEERKMFYLLTQKETVNKKPKNERKISVIIIFILCYDKFIIRNECDKRKKKEE